MKTKYIILAILFVTFSVKADTESFPQSINNKLKDDGFKLLGNLDTFFGTYLNTSQTSISRGLTQPSKNNYPALNLASLGIESTADKVIGRLIFQAGTSVDENYSSERTENFKYIQEANIGYKFNDKLSILGGIYPGHIGLESFTSMDNLTYTRSFHAEFSPYYQRGVRLRYQLSDEIKLEVHALSGYQEISETRLLPALGTLAQYGKDGETQIAHTMYLGHRDSGTRILNDIVLKIPLNSIFLLNFIGDIGVEDSTTVSGTWGGIGSILEAKVLEQVSLVLRAEKFIDNNRVVTGFSDRPLDMNGFSVGVNYKPVDNIFLRSEARSIFSSNKIFSEDDSLKSNSTFFVASLGVTF